VIVAVGVGGAGGAGGCVVVTGGAGGAGGGGGACVVVVVWGTWIVTGGCVVVFGAGFAVVGFVVAGWLVAGALGVTTTVGAALGVTDADAAGVLDAGADTVAGDTSGSRFEPGVGGGPAQALTPSSVPNSIDAQAAPNSQREGLSVLGAAWRGFVVMSVIFVLPCSLFGSLKIVRQVF